MPLRLLVGLLVVAVAIPAAPSLIVRFQSVAAQIGLRAASAFR
jgi:hypothetical protein